MVTFITLHRGPDVPSARLIALSCDPTIVAQVAEALIDRPPHLDCIGSDPALRAMHEARREALRVIAGGLE
jgi:hypothetical protein